jgi:septal ring factor EnvC (AmiA/AmiB activator)
MLQAMRSKVEAEGRKESDLFDKYMCFCETNRKSLKQSIDDAESQIPQLESSLKEWTADKQQTESDIGSHEKDHADATQSLATARSTRDAEAREFQKEEADSETNIAAMGKAIDALRKGMADGFLQTSAAATLRRVVAAADLRDAERDTLDIFVSGGQSDGYNPQSGEIVGILDQLRDSTISDLDAARKDESEAIAEFNALVAAKNKEIATLKAATQQKKERVADLNADIANAARELKTTSGALESDRVFFADLQKSCVQKKSEWEERSKTRSDELSAIADTIKILNDDDSLDLFKKTLPSASLLQVKLSAKDVRQRARKLVSAAAQGSHSRAGVRRLHLISRELRHKKKNFDKVIKMVDDMVALLGGEQTSDDEKKKYCKEELSESSSRKKSLDGEVSDLRTAIEGNEAKITALKAEILKLENEITDLDKEVVERTDLRKDEHAEYVESMASSSAAKDLLNIAKTRLTKFYGPKAAGTEFSQQAMQSGDSERRDAPPTPPETWGDYKKKSSESSGILSMIDLLSSDIEKEMQESKADETSAQATYESFIEKSKAKRWSSAQDITAHEQVKAKNEAKLHRNQVELKEKQDDASEIANYITNLHKTCDWLLENFDARATARAAEVESLRKAKSIMSGAGVSSTS